VNEVIVPVTVTDEKGRFVSDLDKATSASTTKARSRTSASSPASAASRGGRLSDGHEQRQPLQWSHYQDAAIELALNLLPNDKKFSGYLISYSNEAELSVNTTIDPEPIVEKLRKMKPGGGAALYDAIWLACTSRKLVEGEPIEPRRIL